MQEFGVACCHPHSTVSIRCVWGWVGTAVHGRRREWDVGWCTVGTAQDDRTSVRQWMDDMHRLRRFVVPLIACALLSHQLGRYLPTRLIQRLKPVVYTRGGVTFMII